MKVTLDSGEVSLRLSQARRSPRARMTHSSPSASIIWSCRGKCWTFTSKSSHRLPCWPVTIFQTPPWTLPCSGYAYGLILLTKQDLISLNPLANARSSELESRLYLEFFSYRCPQLFDMIADTSYSTPALTDFARTFPHVCVQGVAPVFSACRISSLSLSNPQVRSRLLHKGKFIVVTLIYYVRNSDVEHCKILYKHNPCLANSSRR